MRAPRLYRRLAFGHQIGVALGGWNTLYLAPDHLLLRTSNRFVESYRRFYFRDIEAVTICKTVRGIVWNFIWSVFLFLAAMFLIYRSGWVSAICVNVFFALLIINIARGTTCETVLQTRVQTRLLPLRRIKGALKVMDDLAKKIAAAQADIVPVLDAPEVARSAPPPLPNSLSAPPPLPGKKAAGGRSWVHLVTFGLLLLGGLLAIWEGRQHHPVRMYFTFSAIGLNIGWAVAALVQQRRQRLPARVIPVAWIDVVGHALGLPMVYTGFSIPYAIQGAKISQATGNGQPAQLGLTALRAMPGFHYVLIAYGAACLLLGAAGYVLMVRRFSRMPKFNSP